MVKPPRIRHSKSRKDPVTIELGPDEVSRVPDELRGDADPATPVDEQMAPISAQAPGKEAGTAGEPPVADITDMPEIQAAPAGEKPTAAGTPGDPNAGSSRFGRGGGTDEGIQQSQPLPARRGGFSAVAAGLLGGLIVLGGVGALHYAGLMGARDDRSAALETEIATLRDQMAAIGPDQRVEGLAGDIGALRSEIAALRDAAGASQGLEDVTARIGALEERLENLASGGGAAEALEGRLASLEQAVRSAGDASGAAGSRLDAIESRLNDMQGQVQAQADQPQMALAIAVSALKSAADRGGPFVQELDTYAAVAPDGTDIAALRAHAEKGVPTRASILAETPEAARAMVAAARPVDPNAGFLDKLISSASSLVDVRPIGTVEGSDPGAVAARMEAAVQAENYQAALAEYEALPEAAKAAGAGFAAKLKARREVDALIGQATAAALSARAGEG